MSVFDLIFQWRRDRREGRQEVRDDRRNERESREELLALFRMLIEVAPDEAARSKAKAKTFEALWGLAAQVEADILPRAEWKPPLDTEAFLLSEDTAGTAMGRRLVSLAEELCQSKQHSLALALLSLADDFSAGEEAHVILLRATILEELGRFEDAMAEVERLAERPGGRRIALRRKSLMLLDANQADQAEAIARQMVAEEDDVAGLATLSAVAAHEGNYERARELINKALDKRPEDTILLEIELLHEVQADSDDVDELAAALLAAAPDNLLAHRVLATRCVRLQAPKPAIEHARRVVELVPGSVDSHLVLAHALEQGGDYQGALHELGKADELAPTDARIAFHRLRPLLLMPDSDFSNPNDRQRRVISTLSTVIEARTASTELRATALLIRAVFLLVEGARSIADLDFHESIAVGLPQGVEAVATEHLQKMAAAFSKQG